LDIYKSNQKIAELKRGATFYLAGGYRAGMDRMRKEALVIVSEELAGTLEKMGLEWKKSG